MAVVPRGYGESAGLARIGVAFVDTPEGRAALTAGAKLAGRGEKLHVVTPVAPIDWTGFATPLIEDRSVALEAAERVARAAVQKLAGPVDATVEAVYEHPVSAFVQRSEAWDLLVCSSRGTARSGPFCSAACRAASRTTPSARCWCSRAMPSRHREHLWPASRRTGRCSPARETVVP